ncbi:major facilitator superfamily-domain-containing protein [Podospora appendiculata]|uniref:Major facilitator superfamily-domain-containing protein n=1 Tax=Podospora appendiculata TaxID=314037 RepID=A0AAE0XGY3_9PEZI|nr:major facilitator superfamily-domain-containing protein [Podospora appendiculata]
MEGKSYSSASSDRTFPKDSIAGRSGDDARAARIVVAVYGTPSPLSSSSSSSLEKEKPESDRPPPNEWARGVGFWRCFIGLCIPILLSAFEGSVVSTALPTISQSLGLGPNSSWVATAFLLASIICQPLYGQLADIWGRRYLMMMAVVIFGIGSAVSGAAGNGAVIIFGRITQGMGSGGIDLFAELILCDIIPLKKRGHYVAIKAAIYALGTTVGPVLGGVFAETNWRWCFGVNIPVCVVALVMMWMWLQVSNGNRCAGQSVASQLARVDFLGIGLLTMSVVFLLFALSAGGAAYPWTAPVIIGTGAAGLTGIVGFALWERCQWCGNPIMAPHVFSNRTTVAAFIVTIIHGFLTYGFQFYLPPFFQAVLGATPTESGVLILPCTLTIVVLAAVGGPLLARFGKYRLMHRVGFLLMATGFILCTVYVDAKSVTLWIAFSFLVGIGSGIIVSTTLPTVLVELTDKENAAATGSWAFLRGLGSLLGVAIPNAAFNARFSMILPSISDETARSQLSSGRAYEHASATFIDGFGTQVKTQIVAAFSTSLGVLWILFLVLAVVGTLVTFLERQVKLRKDLDSDFGLKQRSDEASDI